MIKEEPQTQPKSSSPSFLNTNTVLVVLLIIASFFLGSLITKVQYLEKGGTASNAVAGVQSQQPTGTQPQQQAAQPQATNVTTDQLKALFTYKTVNFGDKNSKNILVEVADPSCPYCHAAAGLNPTLSNQMGPQFKLVKDGGTYVAPVQEMKKLVDSGKAAFVWIYSPGHGNGEMGTKAMYCANEQGKFWEVHDKLMTNEGYTVLNDQVKNDKAKSQELASFLSNVFDASQMKNCLESGKYDTRISQDTSLATSLGVQGTPGFFVNTTKFAGAYSWNDMKSAVK